MTLLPGDPSPQQTAAAKVSKSQRERYDRERQERARLRSELHRFALWLHPIWDDENKDDVAAALVSVDRFLEGGDDAVE